MSLSIRQMADITGLTYQAVTMRVRRGWSEARILSTPKGEYHPLTKAEVEQALEMVEAGFSQRTTAKEFGVSIQTISNHVAKARAA